jgi:hypothetical protein
VRLATILAALLLNASLATHLHAQELLYPGVTSDYATPSVDEKSASEAQEMEDIRESVSPTPSAQSGAASATPTVLAPTNPALTRVNLRVDMAQAAFNAAPTIDNRAALVLALERVVELTCMPRLVQTLQHLGIGDSGPGVAQGARGDVNPHCRETLLRVFKLDSSSPIAFCARDGIDSKNCSDAYQLQSIAPFGASFRPPEEPEPFRPGTRLTVRDATARIFKEIKSLRERQKSAPSLQQRIALRQLFDRLLVQNCGVTRLALREVPNVAVDDAASRDRLLSRPMDPNVPVEKYIEALVQRSRERSSDGSTEDKEKYGPAHYRLRSISDACMFFVREALSTEPEMGTAICHRDGFSSPSCITTLRKERASTLEEIQRERAAKGLPTVPPDQATRGPRSGSGMSTF